MSNYLNGIKAGHTIDPEREKQLELLWSDLHTDEESENVDSVQQQILSELKSIRQGHVPINQEDYLLLQEIRTDVKTIKNKLKMLDSTLRDFYAFVAKQNQK